MAWVQTKEQVNFGDQLALATIGLRCFVNCGFRRGQFHTILSSEQFNENFVRELLKTKYKSEYKVDDWVLIRIQYDMRSHRYEVLVCSNEFPKTKEGTVPHCLDSIGDTNEKRIER